MGAAGLTAKASWDASRSLSPLFRRRKHTHTQRARDTHSPPIYLYPWVDIPTFAFW